MGIQSAKQIGHACTFARDQTVYRQRKNTTKLKDWNGESPKTDPTYFYHLVFKSCEGTAVAAAVARGPGLRRLAEQLEKGSALGCAEEKNKPW